MQNIAHREEIINAYRVKIRAASKEFTKKEHFKDLLHRLYAGEKEILPLIDAMSAGAEHTVLNIPRKDKIHRGSADTLYNQIIIEFENDLNVTFNHAKEQLAGYLLGQFRSGDGYNFTLIASDFITWKVLAPDVSQISELDVLNEHELILNEVVGSSFVLTENNAEDFYFWIDRFLFKEEKQKATLKRIEEAFGYQSHTFIESYRQIFAVFEDVKKLGDVKVSYEQWKKFLSIAYGSFNDTESSFIIHTYLSVLSKLLAYEVLSNDDFIDDAELKAILNGAVFNKFNIKNFVDNDFYHWVYKDVHFNKLKKALRLIVQEISTFNFINVDEDILKGVYQELIDLDTRHSLGEYYTPDWLCERIVNEFDFKPTDRILDPSCGSGSFLRAAVYRLKELNEGITAQEINACIYGIDIHPLSVQIAKTTILLSLGKEIKATNKPIHINVILANTLLAPEGVKELFGGNFQINIDKDKYKINTQVLDDVLLFDEALAVCEELAEQTQHKKTESIEVFSKILNRHHKNGGITGNVTDSFYEIYRGFKKVKEAGRDSIWKFIVQNLYKPYFLNKKFSYVIGNPPWFTFSSIKNEEYQDILNKLADRYQVKPKKVANFPHLEIAAIFLAHCSSYFLKENGKIAFVLPRSFFNADHHDNTRSGTASGFKLYDIWDLSKVSPLFRIPSAVLFAETAQSQKQLPNTGLKGITFKGTLPAHNCNWQTANNKLKEEDTLWFYSKQGKSTAFTNTKQSNKNTVNSYKKLFKQGATIVPRTFYFVDLDQDYPPDFVDRRLSIKTANSVKADAKLPWKNHTFSGTIESGFVFRTALSNNIVPFALYKPNLVVLPAIVELNDEVKSLKVLSIDELRTEGYLDASRWFRNSENIWNVLKTAKSMKMSANDRLNFQNGLSSQNLNLRYIVLYTTSAKDANATVVDRTNVDLEFIVEHKTYCFFTNSNLEAHFLTAILNSTSVNYRMKDFQTRGLFGPRDVHKKILDVFFPKFNPKVAVHLELAALSEAAHEKVAQYLNNNPPTKTLSAMALGKLRLEVKKIVSDELLQIDEIVLKIIG